MIIAVFLELTSQYPLTKFILFRFNEFEFKTLKNPYLFSPSMITSPDKDCIVKFFPIVNPVLKTPLYFPAIMTIVELSCECVMASFKLEYGAS